MQRCWYIVPMVMLSACGSEGPRLHGEIEEEGTRVVYDTWYHPPGIFERMKGATGVAARISIDDKTLSLSPGQGYPGEWDEKAEGQFADYSAKFWGAVVDKFAALPVQKDRENDRQILLGHLRTLRDAMGRTEQGQSAQGLVVAPDGPGRAPVPVITDPHRVWETEEEAAYSRAVGDQAANDAAAEGLTLEQSKRYGPLDPRQVQNRGFMRQNRQPGWEFRQRIELWKEHAFGTGYDHSGTKTITYRRRQGSQDPFLPYNRPFYACNHGSCPEEGDMRLYEVCDTGVVMDWYVNDGECEGNWMTHHLCNDDTSLQINHAQGVWTGNQCPGSRRGIAPHCGRQFK